MTPPPALIAPPVKTERQYQVSPIFHGSHHTSPYQSYVGLDYGPREKVTIGPRTQKAVRAVVTPLKTKQKKKRTDVKVTKVVPAKPTPEPFKVTLAPLLTWLIYLF